MDVTPASASILIVDDSQENLRVLTALLTHHGYNVHCAGNSLEAVQSAHANAPDLILLDVMMPDLDGYGVCAQLKADTATRDIPVVFLSALGGPEDKVTGFQAGAVDYITKPFRTAEVLARIAMHLNLRRMQLRLQAQNLQLTQESLEKARLLEETQQRARRMALINDMSVAINRLGDLRDVLQDAAIGLTRVLGVEQVGIALLDGMREHLTVMAEHSAQGSQPALGVDIPLAGNLSMEYIFRTRAPLAIEDAQHDPLVAGVRKIMVRRNVQSILLVPMIVRDEVTGTIGCDATGAPRRFTQEEIDLAQTVANLVALRIEQARLFESEREARQQAQGRAEDLSTLYQETLNERGRLRAVIDSSNDGIVLNSLDGRILVVNARALHMLGIPGRPEDWLGKPLSHALDTMRASAPAVAELGLAELARLQAGDTPASEGEFEVPPHYIHGTSVPVRGGSSATGRLVILRDLTEQRAVERMREDMTRAMVHDLRNPLSGISVALSLLANHSTGPLTAKQQHYLESARSNARRMKRLVEGILDVNRLESGQMPIEPLGVRLGEIVAQVVQAVQPLAAEKGLDLRSEVPADLPSAWADPGLLYRVLENLAGNAIKFTPAGGRVGISARVAHESPAVLCVSVSDTGPGIPPEIRDRLFQKFVAGDQAEHGSGLGLAFCRLVLEAHGQRVWLERTCAQGTTVAFSLAAAPER